MSRVKISMPDRFSFSTIIPVRITDINYGGHVGNDTILSILHEARAQYFIANGFTELNLGGVGVIMSDAAIEFKAEAFYGEQIAASVTATEFSKVSFELYYKLEKKSPDGKMIAIAFAKTAMVCYDYTQKKIAMIPEDVIKKLKPR
jgi:acyl-CoA thioesterase FadM